MADSICSFIVHISNHVIWYPDVQRLVLYYVLVVFPFVALSLNPIHPTADIFLKQVTKINILKQLGTVIYSECYLNTKSTFVVDYCCRLIHICCRSEYLY